MQLVVKPTSFAEVERPRKLENWILYAALLSTALFPALSKYQPAQDAPVNSPAAQLVWSVFYVAAVVRLWTMRGAVRPLLQRSLVLCAFVCLMFLSIVWSVAPSITLFNSIELIGTTIIGYYIVARFTLGEFLKILAFTLGTIAVCSLILIFVAPGHGRMDWGSGAWSGIYQEKNNLGAAMALAVISLSMIVIQPKQRHRFLLFAILVLCVALLIGSNSATAFADCMAAGGVALASLACRSRKIGAISRVLTAIALVALGVAVFVFGLSFDSVLQMLGRSATLTGRTDFWPYLQQAIADRPVLGYGYNAFFRSFIGDNYLSTYVVEAGGWSPYHAHNSLLQISLDAGYVGVALLGSALLGGFWRSIVLLARDGSRLAAWPLAILVYLVLGSFAETYFGNYNTFEWIVFVAALLYPLRNRGAGPLRERTSVRAGAAP